MYSLLARAERWTSRATRPTGARRPHRRTASRPPSRRSASARSSRRKVCGRSPGAAVASTTSGDGLLRARVFAHFLVVVGLAATAAAASPSHATSPAASCAQGSQPAWIDYADKWVPFRQLFYKPGIAVAIAHTAPAAAARSHGAEVAYWDMSLRDAVGTPAHPADPARISAVAERLAAAAIKVTGCATPVVALNELYGAHLGAPWSRTNAQYRANVLELVRALASRGIQPHLFISEAGTTAGAAGAWWRSLAPAATIVREVYIPGPVIERLGPSGATVYLRFQLRRAVRNFTTTGISSSRIGLALGFHSGRGGRAGLSATRWFGVVKREALVARQVAAELTARIASVQERTATGWRSLNRIVLAPFHPMRMRVQLANGSHVLHLFVAARARPGERPS